jgi:hypothetical protein
MDRGERVDDDQLRLEPGSHLGQLLLVIAPPQVDHLAGVGQHYEQLTAIHPVMAGALVQNLRHHFGIDINDVGAWSFHRGIIREAFIVNNAPGQVGGHKGLAAALRGGQHGDQAARDPTIPDPLDRVQGGGNIGQRRDHRAEAWTNRQDPLQDFLLVYQPGGRSVKRPVFLPWMSRFERLPA